MQTQELLEALEYPQSPHFLPAERMDETAPIGYSYVFRRALRECALRGIYLLRQEPDSLHSHSVPVVYVAEAESEVHADDIHRKVWNQKVAPFLIVRMPAGIRLYAGFQYAQPSSEPKGRERLGVLDALVDFDDVLDRLAEFRASAIDNGTLWHRRGHQVDARNRVDWHLLKSLQELGQSLQRKLDKHTAHALIGKFVYLRYLLDRKILSDRKLQSWRVDLSSFLGRDATLEGFMKLVGLVDEWLNGSIFPIPLTGKNAPTTEHIREVASVFKGDDPVSGQLHLDFQAYDFSFIPIETLSVIYEQFLSAEGRSRKAGAYYTPLPLVDFVLAEMDGLRPLEGDMRVLDPSCGSGAFLVQCYRRLIEQQRCQARGDLPPEILRDLLTKHIYGVDRDPDACRVAELSLILTMLDYIEPPDLEGIQFKL